MKTQFLREYFEATERIIIFLSKLHRWDFPNSKILLILNYWELDNVGCYAVKRKIFNNQVIYIFSFSQFLWRQTLPGTHALWDGGQCKKGARTSFLPIQYWNDQFIHRTQMCPRFWLIALTTPTTWMIDK